MTPLLALSRAIDAFTERVGRLVYWLILVVVLISAANATVRKAFNYSSNAYLEIQWYLFSAVFLLGAGYTLLRNEHVRIDIINARLSPRAQNIIDVIHKYYGDSLGYSAPETRTDYSNFNVAFNTTNYEGVYFPSSWTGTFPGGIKLSAKTNTFISIRPWYVGDPEWSKVASYLAGGSAPVFDYHRFWGEADIATAFDAFAYLFPTVAPPSGF